MCWATVGLPGLLESEQSLADGIADVEELPRAAQMAIPELPQVPFQLVNGVKSLLFDEAFRETYGHGGVVGPLTRLKAKRSTPDHVVDGDELIAGGLGGLEEGLELALRHFFAFSGRGFPLRPGRSRPPPSASSTRPAALRHDATVRCSLLVW